MESNTGVTIRFDLKRAQFRIYAQHYKKYEQQQQVVNNDM